ncbi:MAG: M23 family metallopeptidase, partial [Acidobacteria bacterium]|nr:M23 family metallopeptidase [Acidobacteriota bacterium]
PGLDLSVAEGEPIRAVYEGVVAFSDWFKGYGNLIVLEHGDGFMSVYAHASDRLVSTGDRVSGGQVIARAGDTGSLDGPKLYFEIIKDGKPENPVGWLTRR